MIAIERLSLAKWQSRRRELRKRVFGNDPNWAPYPKFIEKRILDERHNPFWKGHRLLTWAGTRDGIVGCTVGLILPHEPNADPLWFGFFDAVFDQELVDAVMNEMIDAARSAGGTDIMGPANPNLYYEPGVQVSGFRCTGSPGLAASPPYYSDLLENAGLTKAKDLLGLVIPTHPPCPPALRHAMRVGARRGFVVSQADISNTDRLIDELTKLHTATFTANWGEPRLSRPDVAFLWSMFRDMIDKRLVLFAHDPDGRLVGVALAVPNRPAMFRRMRRARTPIGNLLALTSFGEVESVRLAIFGIHPDYRFDAATGALLGALWEPVQATGARFCEISWVLEDNDNLLAMLAGVGAISERRWRVYSRELA